MTMHQRIQRDHWLLICYHLALANSGILEKQHANGALDNWFQRQEEKLPLCLKVSKSDVPPPPNWRAVWRAYGFGR